MKLKKLKLQGFKSFASSIVLDFDTPITAIVGPNGCGKSNLVDAFRWVTGEQSAKSIRGEKMLDVLFNGTETRSPLNFAEVSLTFTEIDGAMPIEFEEVTITRRLYRDGNSEYLINKAPARLKDIQLLLTGTGVGKNAFSIFEQGKLDQIINVSALDRRAFFDECAGIGRFIFQKKETLRKLEQSNENFLRLKDLFGEVEKQTRQLRRQAAAAKSFIEQKNELELLEKRLLKAKHEKFWQSLVQLNAHLDEKENNKQLLQIDLETFQKENGEEKTIFQKLQLEERALSEQTLEANAQVKSLGNEKKNTSLLLLALKEREEKTDREQIRILERKESDAKMLEQAIAKFKILDEEKLAKSEMVKMLSNEFHLLEDENLQKHLQLQKLQKNLLESSQSKGTLVAKIHEKEFHKKSMLEKIEAFQEALSALEEKNTNSSLLVKEKKKKEQAQALVIEGLKENCAILSSDIKVIKIELAKEEKEVSQIRQELSHRFFKCNSLKKLQEEGVGLSKGTQVLLKASKTASSSFFKKLTLLAEMPQLSKKSELLTSFHAYFQTLVVETFEDLKQVLDFAKEKKLKDFSLLCLEFMKGRKIISSHFTKQTKTTSDLEALLSLCNSVEEGEIVSKDGFKMDLKKVIFSPISHSSENDPFLREKEIQELTAQVENFKEKEMAKNDAIDHLKSSLLQKNAQWEEAEEKRRKQEIIHSQEHYQLQMLLGQIHSFQNEIDEKKKRKKEIEKLLDEEKNLIEPLRKSLSQLEKQMEAISLEVKNSEEALEKNTPILSKKKDSLISQEKSLHEISEKWHALKSQIQQGESAKNERERESKRLLEEKQDCEKQLRQLLAKQEKISDELGSLADRLKQLEEMLQSQRAAIASHHQILRENETNVLETQKKLTTLESETHRLSLERSSLEASCKSLEMEFFERFQKELKEEEILSPVAIKELEEAIYRLKMEMGQAGAVNFAAIEQEKEEEMRLATLEAQIKDLSETKKDLENVISSLEQQSRKQFKETFEQIRHNFQKNFQTLFQGGMANLEFTDSKDVLEAGIEIFACPPGKQLKNLALLSGGERCLTALALLFAFFEIRPAPFCILDEVDAPLDDTNVDRFTNLLSSFSDKTQFLLVTHNKKTMKVAKVLFGVSMEEKGISKVISLAFEKVPEEALR